MGPGSLTGPLLGLEAHHGADECPSGSPRGSQHCETNSDRTVHRNQRIVSQSDCSDNSLRGSLITDEFTHTSDLPASNKTSKYGKLVPRNGDGNHLQALQCQTEAQSKGEDLGQSEIDDDLKSHMLLAQSLTTTEASCKSTSEDDSTSHEKENTVSAGQDGKGDSLFFARWMTTLRRKNFERHHTTIPRIERWVLDDFDPELNGLLTSAGSPSGGTHQKSYSGTSSLKFISAVKSASVTLASASLAPLSRKSRQILRAKSEHWRSGISDTQGSIDSGNNLYVERMADEGAWLRSFQRRNILDELLDSEEYYIKDIKALDNAYYDILKSQSAALLSIRAPIRQIINEIVQLHERLFTELQRLMPSNEGTQDNAADEPSSAVGHKRWHSADFIFNKFGRPGNQRVVRRSLGSPLGAKALTPITAADAARAFEKFMDSFSIYADYGAQFDTLYQDFKVLHNLDPRWTSYERGVEALSSIVTSVNNRGYTDKKSLTFPDLLIKPFQRVCKYPLLFGDLCKNTPVCDDPESHGTIERVLSQLREVAIELNAATTDPRKKKLVEATWLLREKLLFAREDIGSSVISHLGRLQLCGVLYVAYEGSICICGQYMVCALYKSYFLLATPNRQCTRFTVEVIVRMALAEVLDSTSGKGLQCCTAPYTFKVRFQFDRRQYEILLSACTAKEEEIWRDKLRSATTRDDTEQRTQRLYHDFLSLDIRPYDGVPHNKNNHLDHSSIRRAMTLGIKPTLTHVIIKNTSVEDGSLDGQRTIPASVARSQSLLSPNSVPTLAARRIDRTRLEVALSDIWTRDVLPYPSRRRRRGENSIKASANSVMRKLSMASISTNFSRRSVSNSNPTTTRPADRPILLTKASAPILGNTTKVTSSRHRGTLVDFHNTPDAFLPEDFDLEGSAKPTERGSIRYRKKPDSVRSLDKQSSKLSLNTRGGSNSSLSSMSASYMAMKVEKADRSYEIAAAQQQRTMVYEDSIPAAASCRSSKKHRLKLLRFWA